MATREEFFAQKQRELEAVWEKEFQQSELLRKQREIREAEEAKSRAERDARAQFEKASSERRKINSDKENCLVCGTEVAKVAVVHDVYNTEDRCIRKPRQAKASGILTQDAWDLLVDDEKKNGFIIKGGATLAAVKLLKDHTPEVIPGGPPNTFGQRLI
jgi:hypothetical protein